jgi:hypothetical protein
MRFQSGIVVGLMLAAGCRDGTSPEAGLQKNSGGGGDRTISGQVPPTCSRTATTSMWPASR